MPENLILPRLNPGSENIRISGVSGSAGIGTGFARLEDPVQTTTVAIEYSTNTQEEINAWSALLRVTNDSLVAELRAISNHVPADATSIFDAYRMILKDDVFTGHVASEIRNGYVIPTALKLSIEHFAAMEDPYLKSRHEDIRHLGNKLYRTWLSSRDTNQDDNADTNVVLIGEALSVSDIASLPIGKLAGVTYFDELMLFYIAILANALGIPCVVGVGEVPGLRGGELLIVDGNLAQLIRKPTNLIVSEYGNVLANQKEHEHSLSALRELPATAVDGVRLEIFANTDL